MGYAMAFFVLGIATAICGYITYTDYRGKNIERLLPNKLAVLLEECSMRIGEKEKQLNRELTEDEKNTILDECYNEM